MKTIITSLILVLNTSLLANSVTFDVLAESTKNGTTTQTLSEVKASLGQKFMVEKGQFEAEFEATEYQKPSIATNGRTALILKGKILNKKNGQTTVVQEKRLITLTGEAATFDYFDESGEKISLTVNPKFIQD